MEKPAYHFTLKSPSGSPVEWMFNLAGDTPEEIDAAMAHANALLASHYGVDLTIAVGLLASQRPPIVNEQMYQRATGRDPRPIRQQEPEPWGEPVDDPEGPPVCPSHRKPMQPSQRDAGYYCTFRDQNGPRGYCPTRWAPQRGIYQISA